MRLRIASIALISCFALAMGFGRRPDTAPETDGVVGDTIQTEGTIEFVDTENEMIVVGGVIGQDTIFYNDETVFPPNTRDQLLQPNAEVRVWYVTVGDRNVATRIEPMGDQVPGETREGEGRGYEDTTGAGGFEGEEDAR